MIQVPVTKRDLLAVVTIPRLNFCWRLLKLQEIGLKWGWAVNNKTQKLQVCRSLNTADLGFVAGSKRGILMMSVSPFVNCSDDVFSGS